jgi:hypothetical protein
MINPYDAPRAPTTREEDDDVAALTTTRAAQIASGAGLAAGVLTAFIGLQGVLMFRGIAGRYMLVMLVLGAVVLVAALRLRRMHSTGAVGVVVATLAVLGANVAWCFFSNFDFLLMPLQLVQEMLCAVAAAFAVASFAATRRADAVRAKGLGF